MEFKQKLHQSCVDLLEQKIEQTESEIRNLDAAQMTETKSSMGDKYETSREMMQRERDNLMLNLTSNKQLLHILKSLNTHPSPEVVGPGSLVETDKGLYYIAVGLGKVTVEEHTLYVISPQSPLGKLLIGKKHNSTVVLNGNLVLVKGIR